MKSNNFLLSCTFLLIFFIFLTGCEKDKSILAVRPWGNYFPRNPGTQWVYKFYRRRYDPIIRDTLTVTVTRDTLIKGKWMQILEFKFSDHIEHHYLWVNGDTLRIINDFDIVLYNDKFVFPLQVGNRWPADVYWNGYKVEKTDTVKFAGRTYFNAFFIHGSLDLWNDHADVSYWFQPGVGILFKDYFDGSREIWKLIDYHIER